MNRFGPETSLHFVAVDDMSPLLTLFKIMVERLGHTAEITTDPQEALNKLKNPKVKGFFVDYEIGKFNGVCVARKARTEILYQGPIAMITGNLGIEDIEQGRGELDIREAFNEGLLIDVVKKPYRAADLQRVINRIQNWYS